MFSKLMSGRCERIIDTSNETLEQDTPSLYRRIVWSDARDDTNENPNSRRISAYKSIPSLPKLTISRRHQYDPTVTQPS